MWTLGEFDFQVASDDLVRPKRTVSVVAEVVGFLTLLPLAYMLEVFLNTGLSAHQ